MQVPSLQAEFVMRCAEGLLVAVHLRLARVYARDGGQHDVPAYEPPSPRKVSTLAAWTAT